MLFASEDDKYARATVSLNGLGVPVGGGALFLECGLFFKETEGSGESAACAFINGADSFALIRFSFIEWSCADSCIIETF